MLIPRPNAFPGFAATRPPVLPKHRAILVEGRIVKAPAPLTFTELADRAFTAAINCRRRLRKS